MKSPTYLLGLDVGTTNCKAVVFDENGNCLAKASKTFDNIYDRLGQGWVEQEASSWTDAVTVTIKEVIAQSGVEVAALALASQRPTIVPVDRNCSPLRLAITWQTLGTYLQAEALKQSIGTDTIYRKTGLNVDPVWSGPMLKYISEIEPDIHKKTYKYVQVQTYVLKWLGVDDFITDSSNASATMLMNLEKGTWDPELCAAVGVAMDKLPTIVPPGIKVGSISKKIAELTGLKTGTPIISGAADSQCSALGAGVIVPGIMNVMIGTAEVGFCYSPSVVFDPQRRILCHAHAAPGSYLLGATILAAGDAYRWLRDTVYGQDVSFSQVNKDVEAAPVGAGGLLFLPHQVGAATPYWDNRAAGVFVGIRLGTNRACMARSVIEGVAMEIAKSITIMDELGADVHEVRITGGPSFPGSPWNQIQCDVYGKQVSLVQISDTGALGAAILAGIGIGLYTDVADGAQKMVKISKQLTPDMDKHNYYADLTKIHDRIYSALHSGQVYKMLSEANERYQPKPT